MAQVASKNIFALLDESAPSEPATSSTAPAKQEKKPTTASSQQAGRRNEYPKRGGYSGGNVIKPEDLIKSDSRSGKSRDGKPSRGGRGGRGGRGREYDRRSGTGRVDGEKKEVAGKGTWGDPLETSETTPAVDGENQENVEQTQQAEEEEKVLTLEQYLASKKPVSVSLTSSRKPNEGADSNQWKNTVVLNKDEEDFIKLGKQQAAASKAAKAKQGKQFLAIEQRFSDQERSNNSGRGRGGERGRGRGGRGRGGHNSYERDFPALKA